MTSFESIGVNSWFYFSGHGQLSEDLAYRAPRSGEAAERVSACRFCIWGQNQWSCPPNQQSEINNALISLFVSLRGP